MSAIVAASLAGTLVALVAVLLLGVLNTARGGAPERSQRLMRSRVVLQGVAIVLFLVLLALRG